MADEAQALEHVLITGQQLLAARGAQCSLRERYRGQEYRLVGDAKLLRPAPVQLSFTPRLAKVERQAACRLADRPEHSCYAQRRVQADQRWR